MDGRMKGRNHGLKGGMEQERFQELMHGKS